MLASAVSGFPTMSSRICSVHGRRDMPTLVATLAALDRHSLATQRAITVPLLRDWLQQDLGLAR
jgi:chromosomal replication initiation ATPase DnaA